MPDNYESDIILPDGFDPETGWTDAETPTEEQTPTTETESVETTVETETEPAGQTEVPAVEVKPQTVKVKFNHEERELSLDEAAVLAQKGMNYDKIMDKLNGFEATNAKSNRLARNLGYKDVEEMIAAAEQNYINKQIRELQDEGNTEAMAKFLVEQRMKEQEAAAPKVEPAEESRPKLSSDRMVELQEFVTAYPGITKLPDEVIQANRTGTRLLVAYEQYKNREAQKELAILKQNQASAAKAPVSGTVGKTAPAQASIDDDPFMRGFNASYNGK